jgi:probable phosphoglycerate mutase
VTTTLLLIRHASHGHLGRTLIGRMPGVSLNENGRAETDRLARHLSREPVDAVETSPRDRARETAEAVAAAAGAAVEVAEDLDEIDFGLWTGKSFDALDSDPHWRRWNEARADAGTPGGDTMRAVQERIVGAMQRACRRWPGGSVALVSHGDVIKAGVAHHLGLSLDALHRFDIAPASVTCIAAGDWGSKVLSLNQILA